MRRKNEKVEANKNCQMKFYLKRKRKEKEKKKELKLKRIKYKKKMILEKVDKIIIY